MYSTPLNAQMARRFGLSWMVTTDHGGPNHSKFNLTHAYEELKQSRQLVPEVLQFYGMELNMPAMDHHTLIIPNVTDESSILFEIESRFDANDAWPLDPARNTEAAAAGRADLCQDAAASAADVREPSVSLREWGRHLRPRRAARVPRQQRRGARRVSRDGRRPRTPGGGAGRRRHAQARTRPASRLARAAHTATPGRIPSAASTR